MGVGCKLVGIASAYQVLIQVWKFCGLLLLKPVQVISGSHYHYRYWVSLFALLSV